MATARKTATATLTRMTLCVLGLSALTVLSVELGRWFHRAAWLPLPVAAIVCIKSSLVARHFIESRLAHPFIAWVLGAFVAFAPAALVLTAFHGAQIARWATL